MNHKCIICGKEITPHDNCELFGYDGDFVHSKCYEHKDEYFSTIDNMSDDKFTSWITEKENKDA